MSAFKVVTILVVVVALLIGWVIVSVPVPEDMDDKMQAYAIAGMSKVYGVLVELAGLAGFSRMETLRNMISVQFRMMNKDHPNVKMEVADFDGVPVKIYEPVGRKPGGPAIVYFHGGGWVLLDTDSYHNPLQNIADQTKFLVVSPEYRLAPEHRYPAAVDDCQKATEYLMKHAEKFKIDPKRVAVMGDSAGGNLAAAVSIAMRNKNPALVPKIQVPIYPVLQGMDFTLPSYQNDTRVNLSHDDMIFFVLAYLLGTTREQMTASLKELGERKQLVSQSVWKKHGHKLDHANLPKVNFHKEYKQVELPKGFIGFSKELDRLVVEPTFAPLMADDLKGLPEAVFLTCKYDVLRDESFLYIERLRKAGVKVTHHHDPRCYHGSVTIADNHHLLVKANKHLAEKL